jgi:hypothetical protein
MRDAIAALEAAMSELEQARAELPDDLRTELDGIIEQTQSVLSALRAKAATEGSDRADATG